MNLQSLTPELEAFAAWRDILLWKLNNPTVHFEFSNIMAEVREFKRECDALASNIRRASA